MKNAVHRQQRVNAQARSLLSEKTKLPQEREGSPGASWGDSAQSRDIHLVEEGIVLLSMLIRPRKCTFSTGIFSYEYPMRLGLGLTSSEGLGPELRR
jgi:hypothetical protein